MQTRLGVYIHFPWCRSLCPYCDFPVAVTREDRIPHTAYLDAILTELDDRADEVAGRQLVSIYFGGGTPSLWQPACMAQVVTAVTSKLGGRADALEITIEANPSDCVPDIMAQWLRAGINRVSIGVQSVEPAALLILGRDHRMGDGVAAVRAAQEAGFARISADVIFGVPGVGPSRGRDRATGTEAEADTGKAVLLDPSVAAAADIGVGHLSVYELTIEERTAFGRAARAGTLVPVDEDTLAATYEAAHYALAARGYEHYEVSSYARPGHRAVHNTLYWHGGEYLGLGTGAASFVRAPDGSAVRTTNHRAVRRYMRARGPERVAVAERLSPAEVAADLLWLGMRTADGISLESLQQRPDLYDWLLQERLADLREGRICPTLRGFLYSDHIASRLFGNGIKPTE